LLRSGAEKVVSLDEILTAPVDGSGYNADYGVLGSNLATENSVKLFPRDGQAFVDALQAEMKKRTGKHVECMVYGDGAFKDPVGGIWELADPVCSPAFTSGLNGKPNEIKLKYLADNDLASLNGEAAIEAICGTSITEAINEFAQAYADAWINGTSMAEGSAKVVKNLIRDSIVGLLEKELNSGVTNLMTKIAEFMADGVLEPWEEAELQRMKEELDQQAEEYLSGAGSILNDSFEQEALKGGFNTMSQETADELNGRFTALQISGEEVKNQMVQAVIHLTNMASVSSQNGETLNLILEQHAKSNDYLDEISACTKKILASFGKKIDVLNYKLQTI